MAFQAAKSQLQDQGGVATGALDFSDLDRDGVRQLGERLKGAEADLAIVIFGRGEPGKDASGVPFVALCAGSALDKGLKAGDLAKTVKGHLGGGGGGRPDSAQGQGETAAAIPAAIHDVVAAMAATLG